MKPERKSILEWAADCTFRDEQFGMWFEGEDVEAYFPPRPDIDKHDATINAMLALYRHPQWPRLDREITKESALRVIYSICIADALHETLESLKMQGERPIDPHPVGFDDPVWVLLLDIGQQAAMRLMKEHPQ